MMSIKMKAGLGAFLAIAAFTGLAMPSKQEIARALTEVNRAMDPKRDEHVKGKIEASAVADYALTLVGECGTEAEKFLLYKEAVNFYAKASSYQKAVKATEELLGAIKDVPEETVLAMLKDALVKSRKEGGELAAYYENRCEKYQRARNVEKALKAYKKDPANATLQTKYAEALALAGNWQDALAEFAKAGGPIGEQAKKEIKGLGGPGASWKEAGDFWWSYYVVGENRTKINEMKIHAAELYQKAIDTQEVTGLAVRNLIANIEKACPEKVGDTKAGGYDWYVPRNQTKPKTIAFKMADGHTIEFLSVPAGSFKMSNCSVNKEQPQKGFHMVTLTKPFWMSKHYVTVEDWAEFDAEYVEKLLPAEKPFLKDPRYWLYALENRPSALKFMTFLNNKYSASLPEGYVFRLPTEAEYERAVMMKEPDVLSYAKISDRGLIGRAEPRHLSREDRIKYNSPLRYSRSGAEKRTTKWGFVDICSSPLVMMLDSFEKSAVGAAVEAHPGFGRRVKNEKIMECFSYQQHETDPFRTALPARPEFALFRGATVLRDLLPYNIPRTPIRLVIGPDVEKAAREAKK